MIYSTIYSKKLFLPLFLFLSILLFAQKKFTIVLDAGHGGHDNGAYRTYGDLGTVREKDITLDITLKVGAKLEKNKDFKVIYTRKIDEYPSLVDRTRLANRNKADLFVSVHVNSSKASSTTTSGTETYVQGPDISRANLEVAKAENDVIYLDEKDKEVFASYDPTSPESLIALKIQQEKYREASLTIGSFVEDYFSKRAYRNTRGVKQANLHVLREVGMPSILIETGFVNNYDDAKFLSSEEGKNLMAESIHQAILDYKKALDRKSGNKVATKQKEEKPKAAEVPLKNDMRILLFSSPKRFGPEDPEMKGLKNVTIIKENNIYKYFYGIANLGSIRDINLKTAKDAGFKNAYPVGFVPNQKMYSGYYTIELLATPDKLSSNHPMLQSLKNVERNKENGMFYYTYSKVYTLEDAIKLQKDLENKGIKNTVIQKIFK